MNFFSTYKNTQNKNIYILFTEEGAFLSQPQIEYLYGIDNKTFKGLVEILAPYVLHDELYYSSKDVLSIGDTILAFNEIDIFKKFLLNFKIEEAFEKILQQNIYKIDGVEYYLKKDSHGSKHTSLDYKEAMKPEKPATFNRKFKNSYDVTLKKVIIACATANKGKSKFINIVDFGEETGIDLQTKATHIELYYGEEIGSHIRPKIITNKDLTIKLSECPRIAQHQQLLNPVR